MAYSYKLKLYLWLFVFVTSVSNGYTYTPLTWINGTPDNLFAPICLADPHSEKKVCSSWQGHIRTNLFDTYQDSGRTLASGVAMQGHLHLDKLLHNLYAQVYVPAVLTRQDIRNWTWNSKVDSFKEARSESSISAAIADVPFLIGWTAVKKKSFHLDAYVLGIVPMGKHALFHHGTVRPSLWFDNHFSCGLGSSCLVRFYGNSNHHLDWLSEADVTFFEGRKENSIFWAMTDGEQTKKLTTIAIKRNAGQLYKVQTGLAYAFKHFVSNLGVLYCNSPSIKCSLLDTTLTDYLPQIDLKTIVSYERLNLFSDIGWRMHLGKLPSYVTLGVHIPLIWEYSDSHISANIKFGFGF